MTSIERIKELATEICQREGCRLYDVEYVSGSHGTGRKLLIYVDKEGGANLEDCEKVSKGVSLMLDVEDAIPGGEYILEVSSPGLDRPLKEKWHFEMVLGKKIHVQSTESLIPDNPENYKRFKVTGVLEKIEGESFLVKADGQDFMIPFSNIKKSYVVHEFETKGLKK